MTTVVSQVGAPDDGTDTGGFGNTEYFVDLKPKEQWRPVFRQDKDELIAAMNRELAKYPGAFWNFSQPIEDNVDETLTGTKGRDLPPSFMDRTWTFSRKKARRSRRLWPRFQESRIWGCSAIRGNRTSISPSTVKRVRDSADQCGGHSRRHPNGRRRFPGQPSPAGRGRLQLDGALSEALSRHERGDSGYSHSFPFGRAGVSGAGDESAGQRWSL